MNKKDRFSALYEWRTKKNLSQTAAGESVGVTKKTWSCWESRKRSIGERSLHNITASSMELVAKRTGISIEAIKENNSTIHNRR